MNKLKQIRIEKGMTQKEFSEFLGVPFRSIQNWETGQRRCPEYVEKLIVDKNEILTMLQNDLKNVENSETKQYIEKIINVIYSKGIGF